MGGQITALGHMHRATVAPEPAMSSPGKRAGYGPLRTIKA